MATQPSEIQQRLRNVAVVYRDSPQLEQRIRQVLATAPKQAPTADAVIEQLRQLPVPERRRVFHFLTNDNKTWI